VYNIEIMKLNIAMRNGKIYDIAIYSCGRHFHKSIVNDYVQNKKLSRNILCWPLVWEDITLLIQNIAETYQELTSVKFVEPFFLCTSSLVPSSVQLFL